MNLIASSLPGRLRLRAPALCNAAKLEALRAIVARWRDVLAVETNPQAGSLLVRYDAARLDRARFEARAVAAAEKALGVNAKGSVKAVADETAAPSHRHGGTQRVRANRWAKRGMLASLAVSLLLAGLGRKRWHALAGGLFLHALAAHLWVHRRRILK
ncbi:MAG: hypothetical protein A2Z95_01965 [Gallionellales bacterium GWA2_60_18]|nr:MAG: hypothetical protein A2Z95_01965 [Gallionellales bacterium GWA2_60_18]